MVRSGDELQRLGAAEQRPDVGSVHLVRREGVPVHAPFVDLDRSVRRERDAVDDDLAVLAARDRISSTMRGKSMISPNKLDTWHSATILVSLVTICSSSASPPAPPFGPGYHQLSLAPDRLERLTHGPMLASCPARCTTISSPTEWSTSKHDASVASSCVDERAEDDFAAGAPAEHGRTPANVFTSWCALCTVASALSL